MTWVAASTTCLAPVPVISDGDVHYAVTTNEVENAAPIPIALGVLAPELAWHAVLTSFDP